MKIDIKTIYGKTPTNQYEAAAQAIKAQQELIEALHIIQSAYEYPELIEFNQKRMKEFLIRFCIED